MAYFDWIDEVGRTIDRNLASDPHFYDPPDQGEAERLAEERVLRAIEAIIDTAPKTVSAKTSTWASPAREKPARRLNSSNTRVGLNGSNTGLW